MTHPNGHTLTGSDGSSIETDLLELHHLRWPWAVDTGSKRYVHGPEFETVRRDGRVVRLDDGFGLPRPYPTETKYSPTAVAVDPRGCVWVADGYGQSLVHRYTSAGELDLTLDGFVTPHSVAIVDGLVLVCDRGNGRIQEYDLDGNLLRTLAQGVVVTPTDLVAVDDRLVVTDFTAGRITVLTRDGELVEHLCTSERSPDEDGWPNMRDGGGNLVRPETTPGVVNSPHTLAADENGDLYVTEWLIGGRVTKLARYRGGTWISD